jgi:hypothetical protein
MTSEVRLCDRACANTMGAGSILGDNSLLMKGESLPPGTT